jgi:hypothetical protein
MEFSLCRRLQGSGEGYLNLTDVRLKGRLTLYLRLHTAATAEFMVSEMRTAVLKRASNINMNVVIYGQVGEENRLNSLALSESVLLLKLPQFVL